MNSTDYINRVLGGGSYWLRLPTKQGLVIIRGDEIGHAETCVFDDGTKGTVICTQSGTRHHSTVKTDKLYDLITVGGK